MFRNMVTDLLNYEQITTTETKAKEVRGLAEKMITLGKKGGLHSRRQASSFIMSENVAAKVFKDLLRATKGLFGVGDPLLVP